MRFTHTFKTATASLRVHKARSFLTILGIVIGIAAIILITSIGRGAENLILAQIAGLGAETVVLRPGKHPTGPSDFVDTLFADSITDRDIDLLERQADSIGIVEIAPAVFLSGSVSYRGETYRPQIFGMPAEFMARTFNVYPSEGTLFTESDIRARASVAVIGSKVKEELFGEEEAIGRTIRFKNHAFRIIGIFPPTGQIAFFNVDEVVLVPQTTAQKTLLGINYYNEVILRAENAEVVPDVIEEVTLAIRESHDIENPDDDDFFVESQQAAVEQIQTITRALTVFLSSVVAIALVVGGIGVMNIMLVSVTERTREIGLRKALGATDSNILTQFLIEAVVLTATGGIVGIAIGGIFGFLASIVLRYALASGWNFAFPVGSALLGFAISGLVGLVFGLYPARQASKKSPIEALRYE